ncbi:MAG: GumC family protein [Candidatus Eiseniibacteriota bacterium]
MSPHVQPNDPPPPAIDLQDLLWRLRRYGWLIALPIIACLCAAALYCKFSPRVYQSQILVSVDASAQQQQSPTLDPLVGAVLERPSPRERVMVVDTKIHGRAFLGVLVERLGANRDPELLLRSSMAAKHWKGITAEEYAMRVAIARLGKRIVVSPGRASLIQITALDTDPEGARHLAEMIGDALVEASRQSTLERVQARGEFSSDQIAVYEDRLRKSEEALREFQESKLRKGFSGGAVTDQNLGSARSLQSSTEDAMEQVGARIQTARTEWRRTMGETPVPELRSPATTEDTNQLGQLETSFALALLRTGPESRTESDAIQGRIASARQGLFSEFEQLAEGIQGNYSAEARSSAAGIALDRAVLRSMADRRDRIASEIQSYLKNAESTPRDDMELTRLKQDVDVSREFLATLRREATSTRITEALASSALGPRLEIVEHPLLPLQASSPEPRKIFGFAALLGPLLGAGAVFGGERLASVLRTLEQTENEFGHKVLGTVPRIEGWPRPGSYFENNWPALAILLVLLLTGIAFVVDVAPRGHQAVTSQTSSSR